jgi:cytochrome P450 family 12
MPDVYAEFGSLGTSEGETWQRTRKITNPILLHPKTVKLYTQQLDEIAKDFVNL